MSWLGAVASVKEHMEPFFVEHKKTYFDLNTLREVCKHTMCFATFIGILVFVPGQASCMIVNDSLQGRDSHTGHTV